MVITCSQLSYCPKLPVFRKTQPEKTFDRLKYSNCSRLILNKVKRRSPDPDPVGPCPGQSNLLFGLTLARGAGKYIPPQKHPPQQLQKQMSQSLEKLNPGGW
ncbi:hypothetical protein TNCV_2859541 [Trichonephila clavipes]|nr:hypothetical protein TNCV_2859541 [Trichonephila clavipes]